MRLPRQPNRAHPLLLHFAGLAIMLGRVLNAAGLARHGGLSFGRFVAAGCRGPRSWFSRCGA